MLSVIHTAVEKWIGKMELTTSKTLIHYRILILNISLTAKKQGQKSYRVKENKRLQWHEMQQWQLLPMETG